MPEVDMTDAELVHLAVAGGRAGARAQGELYRRLRGPALRKASMRGLNEQHAEDVFHNAFLRAFTRLENVDHPERFRAWFLTIVRNCSRDFVIDRDEQAGREDTAWREADLIAPAVPSAAELLEDEIGRRAVREAFAAVPDGSTRETARLFYIEGERCGEIARRLSIQKSCVTMRLQRFRAQVEAGLRERFAA